MCCNILGHLRLHKIDATHQDWYVTKQDNFLIHISAYYFSFRASTINILKNLDTQINYHKCGVLYNAGCRCTRWQSHRCRKRGRGGGGGGRPPNNFGGGGQPTLSLCPPPHPPPPPPPPPPPLPIIHPHFPSMSM